MTCPYAITLPEPVSTQVNQRVFFTRARRCVKDLQDHTYRACFNHDNPTAVDMCDVKKELDRMEVSYTTRSVEKKPQFYKGKNSWKQSGNNITT